MSIKSFYKYTQFLSMFLDSKEYLSNRNQMLLSFINGCCNIEYSEQNNKLMLFTISILVEIFYFIRNLNLVLPHCFLVNLLQSFVSGSKTVSALNGKVLPSAGYHTYKTWVEHVGADPIKCPSNDLITYFDNVGKYVIKSYNVSSKRTARADIITATLHFDLGDKMLQSQKQLKPGNWHDKPIH